MTEIEFSNILNIGEHSLIEFKSAKVHNDSLAKEIVAFANTEGGYFWAENTSENFSGSY